MYRPKRPTEVVLHEVVREHLETYLALARTGDPHTGPVPHFVERDFRTRLECGILARG